MQKPVTTPHVLHIFVLLLATLTVVVPTLPASARETTYGLQAGRAPGGIDLVEVALDVGGELKVVEEGEARRVKTNVAANLVYHEKPLFGPDDADGPTRSMRHYREGVGVVKSGEHKYEPALREERRLIGVRIDGPRITMFCPRGTLTFEELELIDVLANSLLLDRLLPQKAVAVGARWEHSDELIAVLLGLDAVTGNDAKSVLSKVAGGKAELELSGRVEGSEEGVSTGIDLKGKYQFDLKAKRITWFGLLVREDRNVGHVDTGFDVVARVQMRITPGARSEPLASAALADVSLEPTAESTQLSYESPGGRWRLLHDRRWCVITEERDQAVLRLIDQGERLAQCNVALLAPTAGATELTLKQFQKDIVGALGESFESFVRASQRHDPTDYRVFQVVAEGESSEVPMQWIYYLVTDSHGRQIVLAFVVQKEMLDRFGDSDEALVRTLRILEPQVAANGP